MEIFGTGQVRSVQALDFQQVHFPTTFRAAEEAGIFYFTYLGGLRPPFLRVRYREGHGPEVRLFGLLLLAFGAPRVTTRRDVAAVRFPIEAGLLVQRQMRNRGELRLEIHPHRLLMAVEGYYASLIGPGGSEFRSALYERTQGAIHLRVAERFLDDLAARLLSVAS